MLSGTNIDIKDWSLAQILGAALAVGVVKGLTFCVAAVWLLPDLEDTEGGESSIYLLPV